MNLQPIDLKGKTIKDAYVKDGRHSKTRLVIEFSDGTKIELPVDSKTTTTNGFETIIRQIL